MRKSLIVLMTLFFASTAFAENDFVLIANRDANYNLIVNYQICTIDRAASSEPVCSSETQATLTKGQRSLKVPIDNWVYDVIVTRALAQDDRGKIIATTDFLEEEACKGFTHEILSLGMEKGQSIICTKTKTV